MDWPLAISRNRQALRGIIAALFALAGFTSPGQSRRSFGKGGGRAVSLPRHILAAILLVLRPAESAVRRLILLAALFGKSRSLKLVARAADTALLSRLCGLNSEFPAFRMPAFALFDPLKSFDLEDIWNVDHASQVRFQFGLDAGFNPASGFRTLPDQGEAVPALQIIGRLAAISHALDTLPNQACRLLRWQARRDAALKAQKPVRITPLRPGLPPGWRQRPIHEVDDVLKECHRLALDMMNASDTG